MKEVEYNLRENILQTPNDLGSFSCQKVTFDCLRHVIIAIICSKFWMPLLQQQNLPHMQNYFVISK